MAAFLKSGGPGDEFVGNKLNNNAILCKVVTHFEFKLYSISARKVYVSYQNHNIVCKYCILLKDF